MPTSTNPKAKNCASGQLEPISTHSLERSKISKTCNVSKDENIPDNKQEMSAIRTLEATVPITSCGNGQKPSKKKRLNLRTKAAASKAKTIEQQIQTANDTDSSEDTEKQQTLSVKNNLKPNDLDKISENKSGGGDSTSKEIVDVQNSSIRCCPVCKYNFTSLDSDFRNLDSDAEINEHINKCLDGEKTETKTSNPTEHNCQLCGKDISKYNTVQRQQHLNRCCDKLEKTRPKAEPEVTSILCPICGKPFKATKSRQTHMKKCAKENNVSTHQLVELNRQENMANPINTAVTNSSTSASGQNNTKANQNTLGFVRTNKRKRKANLPAKDLNDDTQLALALSASMQSDNADVIDLGRKRKKKKKENSELPALLLRSDDEMKKVTEARAAAVLCQWVDNDDEIQCTPALAPSLLVKKYGKESSSEKLEVLSEQTAECDVEDITERCNSPTIEVRGRSNSKKKEKCGCAKKSESLETVTTHGDESKRYFTVDTQSRLWNLASLRTDVVTNNVFYVPNLLPKSTPRKKKATRSANSTINEEKIDHCATVDKDNNKHVQEESPSKASSQNDGLTESQQRDIEMLVELINDESPDTQPASDEKEQNEEIDKTWFPSSGFCVRKDMHEMEDKNKEDADTLLNDLSCMVGNPLLSDVEIVAKDKKKFCAHSFMLSARCSTLAEILHTSEIHNKDGERNTLVRLELLDIDVRAVRAVLTYIYTAYFIPVVENVIEDVEKLVHRWNLNCDAGKWEVIRDEKGQDHEDNIEHRDNNVGDLDVLLKSLWEGEEEIINRKNEDENAFGDSILDDQLGNMEIKIYTQATSQKNTRESNDACAVVLDLDSEDCVLNVKDKAVIFMERTGNNVVCNNDEPSNLGSNVLENEDEAISQNSDDVMCIPETPLKLSPCSLPGQHDSSVEDDHDLTLVEQSLDDVLGSKTGQSSRSDDINDPPVETSSPRCHSSPIAKEFNGDDLDHLNSSPISLPSPSSPVEMMSSPERSPLPENLKDFDMEDESSNSNEVQTFSMQKLNNSLLLHSPYVSPNKCITESMNVESCLDIAYISPGSGTTSSLLNSPNTEDVRETIEYSGLQGGDAMRVPRTVTSPSRTRKKFFDKNEDDSLLDIFATSPDCRTETSLVCNSKQDLKVDRCLDIDISILSQKSSPPLNIPNSKDQDIVMEEAEIELLKAEVDCNEKNRRRGGNTTHRSKQSLVFNSNDQDMDKELDSNQENRCFHAGNRTNKDFNETTTRQSCTETKQVDSWLDDSSLKSKDLIMDKRETGLLNDKIDSKIHKDVTETPRRQFCSITNHVDSWLDDSSFLPNNTSSTEAQSNAQDDDQFVTSKAVNETPRKQSSTNQVDSWLDDSSLQLKNASTTEAQNNEHYYDDDDEFIDYYDDGGFNCDIDDYFNYDSHSTIEQNNLIPDDEKPGTSSSTVQDTTESNVEEENEITNINQKSEKNPKKKVGKGKNNVQTTENENEDRSKDVKKGKNNKTGGKTRKAEKEVAGKQTKVKYNPHQEFKLRDTRTPMLDYSNMATPELKGELKQYGVRPLAKRKMLIKLKEIYKYTHREIHSESEGDKDEKKPSISKQQSIDGEEVEPRSEDTNSQQGSTQDTESCSDSEQNWYEEEQPSDDSEVLSQQSSSNLSKTLMSFLTQDHELYFKILKYMPISVSDVLETIKGNGIKCSAEQLKNFFDEQCITYSEPRPVRVQRRGRRGKNKLTKL